MEIIEKQVEKVKEVPYDGYYGDSYYGRGRNVSGRATAGLTLGVIGTALGAWALFGNGRNGLGTGTGSANININGTASGNPSAFEAWEKSCENTLALQSGLYDWALAQQSQRFSDRQTVDNQIFDTWKSQVDASFNLYKASRDGMDALNARQIQDAFNLYKNQRDGFDVLSKRISDLETKQAVSDAVEPWRSEVLNMKINGVAAASQSAVALEAERRNCADNKIVSYVNNTFYPVEVADVTVGTTATARNLYNPLSTCGCGTTY